MADEAEPHPVQPRRFELPEDMMVPGKIGAPLVQMYVVRVARLVDRWA
jgi:hypothetical protein